MPNIRPSSDLRNHYNEISDFCNTTNKPVFITKNGAGDLVVISNKEYDRMTERAELHRLLDEGIESAAQNNGKNAVEFFAELEKELNLG